MSKQNSNDEVAEDQLTDESEVINNDEVSFDDDNEIEEVEEKFEQKYIRLLAEFDNFKKRTAKESLVAKDNGKIEVFRKLIDTIDTLETALNQLSEEELDNDFTKGIKMTSEKLNRSLSELGLEEVTYENFDPNFHMAVLTDSVEDRNDDDIIEVLQKGYSYDGRLVRQAMVKVNKK